MMKVIVSPMQLTIRSTSFSEQTIMLIRKGLFSFEQNLFFGILRLSCCGGVSNPKLNKKSFLVPFT